jgi:hypothetical protein
MTLIGHERYPHLAAEWHFAKNGGVTLADFRGRRKKDWRICKKFVACDF